MERGCASYQTEGFAEEARRDRMWISPVLSPGAGFALTSIVGEVLQTIGWVVTNPSVETGEHSIEIARIRCLIASEHSIRNKVCELNHAGISAPSEVGDIYDIAKIPIVRASYSELGDQLAIALFMSLINNQQTFVFVPPVELSYQKGVESLADVLERVAEYLPGGLHNAYVADRCECNQIWEPTFAQNLADLGQETLSVLWLELPELILSSPYVRCVKSHRNRYAGEECTLDLIELLGQTIDLPFMDRDPTQDEVIVSFPTVWVARLVDIQEVHFPPLPPHHPRD